MSKARPGASNPLSRSGSCPVLRGSSPSLMATGCNLWAWKPQLSSSELSKLNPPPLKWTLPERLAHGEHGRSLGCQGLVNGVGVMHVPSRGSRPSRLIANPKASPAPSPPPALTPPLLPLDAHVLQAQPSCGSPWSSPSHVSEPRAASPSASYGNVSPAAKPADVPPTRVAVVGAGPVGLWTAVVLARAHARIFQTSAGFRISRHPQAPVINVFEGRADSSGWGSRRVVLAMSPASQDLLNGRLLSKNELCAHHCFSPTCSINFIESVLREEFEKYSQSGFGALHMGRHIEDPEVLLADHDVVFIATGRNWPSDEWREGHGFKTSVGRREEALILKFALQPGPDLQKMVQEARSGVGRFEVPGQPMYILRPGASEDQGWLWIMGLHPDVLNRIRSSIETGQDLQDLPGTSTFTSFLEMWKSVTKASRGPSKKKSGQKPQVGPSLALGYLDQLLRPIEVAPRVTLASFWHSNEVVEHVQRENLEGWIVLVGDAACGKPFYLGTNLNGHFQDAISLLSAPWTKWPRHSQDFGGQSPSEGMRDPFKRYVSEYRKRISESQGFRKAAKG